MYGYPDVSLTDLMKIYAKPKGWEQVAKGVSEGAIGIAGQYLEEKKRKREAVTALEATLAAEERKQEYEKKTQTQKEAASLREKLIGKGYQPSGDKDVFKTIGELQAEALPWKAPSPVTLLSKEDKKYHEWKQKEYEKSLDALDVTKVRTTLDSLEDERNKELEKIKIQGKILTPNDVRDYYSDDLQVQEYYFSIMRNITDLTSQIKGARNSLNRKQNIPPSRQEIPPLRQETILEYNPKTGAIE